MTFITQRETANDNLLAADLDFILQQASTCFEHLRGERVFITGGTGFFGVWLLESFAWANRLLGLSATAVVLSRDPESFRKKAPHLAKDKALQFIAGDMTDFRFPEGEFAYVIHAATESTSHLNAKDPGLLLSQVIHGTERVLAFAAQAKCRQFLLTSSGAVYGAQPADMTHIPESYLGGPDLLQSSSAYAEGKRISELLTTIAVQNASLKNQELNAAIARCFAFIGPYLPLDAHFAIGNFIRDGLRGGPLKILGDGTASRSYLYASDLMIWLWTLLTQVRGLELYNVGSANELTIKQAAEAVAAVCSPTPAIEIAGKSRAGAQPNRYVPCVDKIKSEMQLVQLVSQSEAIEKTVAWNRLTSRTGSHEPA